MHKTYSTYFSVSLVAFFNMVSLQRHSDDMADPSMMTSIAFLHDFHQYGLHGFHQYGASTHSMKYELKHSIKIYF